MAGLEGVKSPPPSKPPCAFSENKKWFEKSGRNFEVNVSIFTHSSILAE